MCDIGKKKKYEIHLYLEQIKYLRAENISIQDKFLSSISIPLAALGLLLYYIESQSNGSVDSLYLILPFLYFLTPYNIIKYTIRMLAINGYIKELEKRINCLAGNDIFLWNSRLINSSLFKGGFAIITTLAQVPIHFISCSYLIIKFIEVIKTDLAFAPYHTILKLSLIAEVAILFFMLIDAASVQKTISKKLSITTKKTEATSTDISLPNT